LVDCQVKNKTDGYVSPINKWRDLTR